MTRLPLRPVLIAFACASLAVALTGCGRKGGLEKPPSAQVAAPALAEEAVVSGPAPNPVYEVSPDEPPAAAEKGRRKSFILDPLLGSK